MVNLENFRIPDKYARGYSYSHHTMMLTEEGLGFP